MSKEIAVEEKSVHQQLMDSAYARWREFDDKVRADAEPVMKALVEKFGEDSNEVYKARREWSAKLWSQEEFWAQLDDREAVAVLIGNMNYQVENGGWEQWCGNRYVQCADQLVEILRETLGTVTALRVAAMVERVASAHEEFEEESKRSPGINFCRCDDDECDCETEQDVWEEAQAGFDMAVEGFSDQFYKISASLLADVEKFLRGEELERVCDSGPVATEEELAEGRKQEAEYFQRLDAAEDYAAYVEKQAQLEAEQAGEEDEEDSEPKKIRCKLLGSDGNAFAVIGNVSDALKRGGRKDLVDSFRSEAMSGDYNGVLQAAMKYVDVY